MPAILLVDDDAEQLAMRRLLLERGGYIVSSAHNAASALQLLDLAPPDGVVMDFRLPRAEDGRHLLHELKTRCPELPVVVLTGWPQDIEDRPEARLVSALLRKPVRAEMLFSTLTRLLTVVLLLLAPTLSLPAQPSEFSFEVREAGSEIVAELELASAGADWAIEGREAALARLSVEGRPPHHLWVFGERHSPAQVFLGRFAPGRYALKIERDESHSAPGAPLHVQRMRFREYTEGSPEHARVAHAPVLFARANTIGRFTDVPMLMYATESEEQGRAVLEYTVIFSNEDGGTNTRNLMARWGRVTDIEYVYRVWLDKRGRPARTLIQTRDHKDVPYTGARFHLHPYLQPVTDNNMVEAARDNAAPMRFQLAPMAADLSGGSRELVMDAEPWMYAIARKELVREKKLRPPMQHQGARAADPRGYLIVELKLALRDAAVQALARLRGDGRWHGSSSGLSVNFIDRDGWVRVTIELEPGRPVEDVAELGVQCMARYDARRKENPDTGTCRVEQIGKVFFLDEQDRPGPSLRFSGLPMELRAGEIGVAAPVR